MMVCYLLEDTYCTIPIPSVCYTSTLHGTCTSKTRIRYQKLSFSCGICSTFIGARICVSYTTPLCFVDAAPLWFLVLAKGFSVRGMHQGIRIPLQTSSIIFLCLSRKKHFLSFPHRISLSSIRFEPQTISFLQHLVPPQSWKLIFSSTNVLAPNHLVSFCFIFCRVGRLMQSSLYADVFLLHIALRSRVGLDLTRRGFFGQAKLTTSTTETRQYIQIPTQHCCTSQPPGYLSEASLDCSSGRCTFLDFRGILIQIR